MFSFGLFMYLIYGGFIAICLYGLYLILSNLLERYLIVKRDHTAALREQNEILKDIAKAVKPNDNNYPAPPAV
ncbi:MULTISPECIES: hypothetical protein [Sphingobacterium]|uniref:hypothetical protein n=1 Tax=Sphingobacterium TaxID=28453 RepID=UPI002580A2A3|nr:MULTISPECIES: hypothetical protein [Sphingobacterium]